ncbi:MAG: hypothetical protein KKD38_05465 [Candidatus Delongbacteria bacterium]|nr:hypothetical protein [Candidatus Delongbacteria bacterium]MCG2759663.1 hypothetical protein [Candidatus Delongbacteria bacterium]
MQKIKEKYHRITDDHSEFDLVYWQAQGSKAIFYAAAIREKRGTLDMWNLKSQNKI